MFGCALGVVCTYCSPSLGLAGVTSLEGSGEIQGLRADDVSRILPINAPDPPGIQCSLWQIGKVPGKHGGRNAVETWKRSAAIDLKSDLVSWCF